jgi:ribosomal protein L27
LSKAEKILVRTERNQFSSGLNVGKGKMTPSLPRFPAYVVFNSRKGRKIITINPIQE